MTGSDASSGHSDDPESGEVNQHIEQSRKELDKVDWDEQPMAVRRLAEVADAALSHVSQEVDSDA